MSVFFQVFSILLIFISLLPFVKNQHWVFRASEFVKIQLLFLQVVATIGVLVFAEKTILFWIVIVLQTALIFYHCFLFVHYVTFFKTKHQGIARLERIKIISANIYQFNQEFDRFKAIIRTQDPVIFVTMESNKDWEIAMRELENDYPHSQKVTLENTYGMHLYSKLPFVKVKTHYFVADDVPSIEAHFETADGEGFMIFCVHPPPPSPTEEETSKERDGDLLSIAKLAKEIEKPILVMGDFNTVAWSRISKLFRKNSELIDGRKGRGILASFHAKYWFLRAPLDLVFHSSSIFIQELRILENIGSDHFPICCVFSIDSANPAQEEEEEEISDEEKQETEMLIAEGKIEQSDNR